MAVERQIELKRRNHRKLKMRKLKAKLGTTTGPEREAVLAKIKKISPWWTEVSLTQKLRTDPTATSTEKKPSAPRAKAPAGPKGPPKGPPEKK